MLFGYETDERSSLGTAKLRCWWSGGAILLLRRGRNLKPCFALSAKDKDG